MKGLIHKVTELRKINSFEEALRLLNDAQTEMPNDANLAYQTGWTYDASGRPELAVGHYQKALGLNLQNDRVGCYVALGSSLRAVGQYSESKAVLEQGLAEFPQHRPLKVFLAMTLYNLGKCKDAVSELLIELAETTSDSGVAAYRNAYLGYSEDLDKKW